MTALDRLVFFGTPEFAVPTLAALVEAGRAPRLVVTQPARPVGRGRELRDPPAALWARRHGLPVEQPARVRDEAFLERLAALAPDLGVVVAFGQIFPRRLLDLPRLGCVNLHASLLPRWRGAAPIQAAIAAGEAATGVTTMRIAPELDSGPILLQEAVEIGPAETAEELSRRLAERGAALVLETLAGLEAETLVPREQEHGEATYAPRLTREDGRADWSLPARRLADRLRAFTPWPGLAAELEGEPVKLLAARAEDPGALAPLAVPAPGADLRPGTVLGLADGRLLVRCGEGTLLGVSRLQRPGRRPLSAEEFARGERIGPGRRFE